MCEVSYLLILMIGAALGFALGVWAVTGGK